MSTDMTTESSIYLAIIMAFLFLGPTLNQVSDYRLLGASSFFYTKIRILFLSNTMYNTGVNEIFAQNVSCIGGVMVCMLISSAVVYGFQLWSN
jgi:hypothetical protein